MVSQGSSWRRLLLQDREWCELHASSRGKGRRPADSKESSRSGSWGVGRKKQKFPVSKINNPSASELEKCLIFFIQHSQKKPQDFKRSLAQENCKHLENLLNASRRSPPGELGTLASHVDRPEDSLWAILGTWDTCIWPITWTRRRTAAQAVITAQQLHSSWTPSGIQHRHHCCSSPGDDVCYQGWKEALFRSWIPLCAPNTWAILALRPHLNKFL